MSNFLNETELVIANDKLKEYLLKHRPLDDKSKFLSMGGYTIENWEVLKRDLIQFAQNNEFVITENNEYGEFIQIIGDLQGVNGNVLKIISVWLKERFMNVYRFITLYPLKHKKK